MIQSLPTPVAMFDRNFNYLAYSSRWKIEWKEFGPPSEGRLNISMTDDFKNQWIGLMQQALAGETLSKDEDLVQIQPGTEIWLRWVLQPWKNANEEIGGVIIMAENITSRKEAEMKLTQASKLSALGEMAGGIAHEINNPLSIIKGYVDLLKRLSTRGALKEDILLQYIEKMDSTVGRISKIVNGMRRFSRESSMDEKVEYSINKIIEETLDICQERINNNGIVTEVVYLSNDPLVFCRPVEISQVILNLVNNSYQAIASQARPLIQILCEEMPEHYRIRIIDSGDGIPLIVRQKLFQPFFTTKDIGVGTGLGLSISRGIIEEHEGHLYYQDDSPNTTFVIELPKIKA
jgi:C4-dicarboxylate-specific signal transduction histidine kinase